VLGSSKLSPLQERVIEVLAGMEPVWTLTGGAALAGIHLGLRTTRDVDLFWRGREQLGDVVHEAERRLRAAGLEVSVLQHSVGFARLRVKAASDVVTVDLVAEPVASIEPPVRISWHGAIVQVDSPHEILVNKLCTLLERLELRDLGDVRALLQAGGDLRRALADAPRKDAGFSPLTLAWVLRGFDVEVLGPSAGVQPADIEALKNFRDELIDELVALAVPE